MPSIPQSLIGMERRQRLGREARHDVVNQCTRAQGFAHLALFAEDGAIGVRHITELIGQLAEPPLHFLHDPGAQFWRFLERVKELGKPRVEFTWSEGEGGVMAFALEIGDGAL